MTVKVSLETSRATRLKKTAYRTKRPMK